MIWPSLAQGYRPYAPGTCQTVCIVVTLNPEKCIFCPLCFQSLAHSFVKAAFDNFFAINSFRTLCEKHRGWVYPPNSALCFQALAHSLFCKARPYPSPFTSLSRKPSSHGMCSPLRPWDSWIVFKPAHSPAFLRPRAQFPALWYTLVALNTAVVLCGSSGFVPDLRTPASVSSVSFQRNLKEDWQRKTLRQHESSCGRHDCASKKAKCKIFQNYRFLPM